MTKQASKLPLQYYNIVEHVMRNRTMFFWKGCDDLVESYVSFCLKVCYYPLFYN